MPASIPGYRYAGTLAELKQRGQLTVSGSDRPILIHFNGGRLAAVDNRCPHMGFPLDQGTLKEGILTCDWHHARFDLCSGCTFDLWADDIPTYEVIERAGEIHVAEAPRQAEDAAYHRARLTRGLRHNIRLIVAKSIIGMLSSGSEAEEVIGEVARFGMVYGESWGQGLTLIAVAARLLPAMSSETRYFVLARAAAQVAADGARATPRVAGEPLRGAGHDLTVLNGWFRQWMASRHDDGAERCLLTASEAGASPADLTELALGGALDRLFANVGHVGDAVNKACELGELPGAAGLRPVFMAMTLPAMASARGSEESAEWRQPEDLAGLLLGLEVPPGPYGGKAPPKELRELTTGRDAPALVEALRAALAAGVSPRLLAREVALAAAWRLAHFATSNDTGDWFGPVHTFIFANAMQAAIARAPRPLVVRGLFQAAMAVYVDRQANVPPARLPGPDDDLSALPSDPETIRRELLDSLDQRADYRRQSGLVARYARLAAPLAPMFDTLALAAAREDLDFHYLQVIEAAYSQCLEWEEDAPERELLLQAAWRYLAAFCPTPRAAHKTATVALKLHRGEPVYT